MIYAGRRFRAEARLAGKIYGRRFGVDVGFADPITEQPELLKGSDFLSFAGIATPVFRVYPTVAHIAEKLHAYTLPRCASEHAHQGPARSCVPGDDLGRR